MARLSEYMSFSVFECHVRFLSVLALGSQHKGNTAALLKVLDHEMIKLMGMIFHGFAL